MMRIHNAMRAALICGVSCLLLAGCGGSHATADASGDAPPPPQTGEAIKPLADAPAAAATAPVAKTEAIKPVAEVAPIPTPMETFRSLESPAGLKPAPLFAEPISDPNARMARLEKAVQDLRNDFDTVTPAIVRMVTMENSLHELVDQLKTLNEQAADKAAQGGEAAATPTPATAANTAAKPAPAATPAATPVKTAASPAPAAAPAPAETAAATPAYTAPVLGKVSAVRVGDHPDMTRIVLDLTARPSYTAELNKDGTRLIVSTPQMEWDAVTSAAMPKGALVSAYKYENGVLSVALRHPAVIKAREILKPAKGDTHYRLIVDLAAAAAEKPAGG